MFPTGLKGLYGIAGPTEADAKATLRLARALLDAGAGIVQLRDKRSDGRELVRVGRELAGLCHEAGALFVVDDRLDVALICGADGVHVGQEDLTVEDVRRVVAELAADRAVDFLVGVSTHDAEQVREGLVAGADYLGYGPVFETSSRPGAAPVQGCERLAKAVALAGKVPVVAIGGITLERVPAVAATGARMAAVIGDIAGADEPAERARRIHEAFVATTRR